VLRFLWLWSLEESYHHFLKLLLSFRPFPVFRLFHSSRLQMTKKSKKNRLQKPHTQKPKDNLTDSEATKAEQLDKAAMTRSLAMNSHETNNKQTSDKYAADSFFSRLKNDLKGIMFWFELASLICLFFYVHATYRANTLTVENFQVGQRAWVGATEASPAENATLTDDAFTSETISITLKNSGNTPALNVSLECCLVFNQSRLDPVPDWDAVNQRRANFLNLFHMKIAEADQSGVLPPGTPQPRVFPLPEKTYPTKIPGNPNGTGIQRDVQAAYLYVIGQLTYRDIFKGTTRRRTKFCFVRSSGKVFLSCPEGQWMD
jgi:hypothetical protein